MWQCGVIEGLVTIFRVAMTILCNVANSTGS